MTSALHLVSGIAILALVSVDFILATIGAAPRVILSDRIARTVFAILAHATKHRPAKVLARMSGVIVMVVVAAFWIAGTALGWTLVVLSDPSAVVLTQSAEQAGFWDALAHVGHLLSTLGGAITRPSGTFWNAVEVLAGVNGMVVLTLAVSFILATVQSVQAGRAFAALLHSLPPGADVTGLFDRLADVVASLNSAPFALYYSHGRAERRLPEALVVMARAAAAQGPKTEARFYALISDLPQLDLPDENADRFAVLQDWAAQRRLGALQA
ncbi:hypothetical protein [Limimaricola pyoseonensis]|uniref:Ion channel n=1 Tax=Limimaricola pyoseonensis TaxID=521013 RepID=A0A1G7CED3_9RHOB|nr:hypothetical protein [Limimaricola pyoseonensis]SDE37722.1 hypothetical protein SAMN04488567_1467 [Limimaricola pyoseonensis]